MKISILILLAAAVAAPGKSPPMTPKYSVGYTKQPFAKAVGRLFDLGDGRGPTYCAGTNAWWLSHVMSDAQVDQTMSEMAKSNLKVIRVWGFGSVNTAPTDSQTVYFQLLTSTGAYINYAANGIPRMDSVVHHAEKYGLKLILPFVNNWGDLGGIASYNTAFGGNTTTWYTDARSQKAYREWIKLMVERYKSSPAVFAWELGNEPRCKGCDSSVLFKWAMYTSRYIKSLDQQHMVTMGDEGWLTPKDGDWDGSYASAARRESTL